MDTKTYRAAWKPIVLALWVCGAFVPSGGAQDGGGHGFRAEVHQDIDDAERKFMGLAEAFTEDQYAWQPGEGVRSTGAVFLHIAGNNY